MRLLSHVAVGCMLWAASAGFAAAQSEITEDFRQFLRLFFADPEFQRSRVRFPLPITRVDFDGELYTGSTESSIALVDWAHLPGPDWFRCETGCYDIVIYDSFSQDFRHASPERVVSFEGVGNGINTSLYFTFEGGKWILVKWDDLST